MKEDVLCRIEKFFDNYVPLDDAIVAILRNMRPWEKVQVMGRAHKGFFLLMQMAVRSEHEDWTDEQVRREAGWRLIAMSDD